MTAAVRNPHAGVPFQDDDATIAVADGGLLGVDEAGGPGRLRGDVTMAYEEVPEADAWARTLGIEVLEMKPERVSARLVAGPQHHQPYGVLHGGVYCSIVEAVASYGAGCRALSLGQKGVLGVSNATDFFRSHSAGELRCEGRPIHSGRSAHVWEVDVTRASDGKLVARGQVRFHVLDELPADRSAR